MIHSRDQNLKTYKVTCYLFIYLFYLTTASSSHLCSRSQSKDSMIFLTHANNSKVWLIDFFFLLWHCCFSFPTQHERHWNKNILAANRPHHGNSIDHLSWVLRKIYPSCQFPSTNSSAATHVLNRQAWYLESSNKTYNHYLASLMIHLSQEWDTKWPDDFHWEQCGESAVTIRSLEA